MAKIRVLIADDSVVVRQMLADVIGRDKELEVVAVAANGRIALERFAQTKPDIVLLDMQMPEMDGLEAVKALRQIDSRAPIVIVSAITERGAGITLDALSAGATDYWTKPKNSPGVEATKLRISEELIPKIKILGRHPTKSHASRPLEFGIPQPALRAPAQDPVLVAIGSSTGGPEALAVVISQLPANFPVPIVIAQHMPPIFTNLLAQRLSEKSALTVREAKAGVTLVRGEVWIAPGDEHMVVMQEQGVLKLGLHRDPPENFCRPSIDVLFRSVVKACGARTLAVVLTGMGQDGLRACEQIRNCGGQILAQDEASSVVWGIPGAVVRSDLADAVLPLPELSSAICSRVMGTRKRAAVTAGRSL
jgi:two-component system chemotaxis response regulator CheB